MRNEIERYRNATNGLVQLDVNCHHEFVTFPEVLITVQTKTKNLNESCNFCLIKIQFNKQKNNYSRNFC